MKMMFSQIFKSCRIQQELQKLAYCISISVFGYEKRKKFPIYDSKNTFRRHFDLSVIEESN